MNEPQEEILLQMGGTKHLITMKTFMSLEFGQVWRWQRDDLEWVSPIYTTQEAAAHMASAGKDPLISDMDWRECYPIERML